jgi:hypothetical protein
MNARTCCSSVIGRLWSGSDQALAPVMDVMRSLDITHFDCVDGVVDRQVGALTAVPALQSGMVIGVRRT